MFLGAAVGGLDQGHGLEVVAAADGRFLAGLERDEKLGHGADERVGEPAFVPGRRVKTGVALGCVGDCRWGGVGILTPADVALGQAVEPLDAPLDSDVGRGTFTGGAGPSVVDGDGAQAVGVFENVTGNAVAVRELRTRIGADGAVNPLGIAEPVAERVHVVDGHDTQRDPALAFLPWHPVRDAAHVDGGQDRLADSAVSQERFAGTHRLVVAHVLVHGQHDAGLFAGLDGGDSLGVIRADRLLREDAFGRAACAGGLDDFELVVRRHGEVEHLDRLVIEQLFDRVVNGWDVVLLGALGCVGLCAGGDGDRVEAGLSVGDQVAVVHDEAAANAADAPNPALGKGRVNV